MIDPARQKIGNTFPITAFTLLNGEHCSSLQVDVYKKCLLRSVPESYRHVFQEEITRRAHAG